MATDVVLVRHGETEWSKSGRHTSVTELELTAAGREVAASLEHRLSSLSIARVFSSPRKRALETASLALPNEKVETLNSLVEWNYGEYEGLTTAEIRETRPDWDLFIDGCPGGESPAQVAVRTRDVIAQCDAVEGLVICFAHGHILRAICVTWLERPMAEGSRFLLGTGSISTLTHDNSERVLRNWNT